MKKKILTFAILFCGITSMEAQHFKKDGTPDMRYKENNPTHQSPPQSTNSNTVNVQEYKRKDGTVIEEHNRTAPNTTDNDNWSTKPNINPDTHEKGTKKPK